MDHERPEQDVLYYLTDPRATDLIDATGRTIVYDDQTPGPDGCCGAEDTANRLDLKRSLDPKRMLGRKEFSKNVAKLGLVGAAALFAFGKAKGVAAYYPCGGYWSIRCQSIGCQAAAYWCQKWCGASSYYSCSFDHWESHNCGGSC